MSEEKKIWTKEQIKDLLLQNNLAVERAIIAIYRRQTESERVKSVTLKRNGRGFNRKHASLGSYLAKWILDGKQLSGEFAIKARRISLFYTKQLTEIANNES